MDQNRMEQFAENMVGMLNQSAAVLLISLGHRSGLLDVMGEMDWASSEEIARKAELNERYVREWLAGTVTSNIVEYDSENRLYRLPKEHAAWLTRAASPNNMAMYAQYITLGGMVEDPILECFKTGGGVPYEKYVRFHEIMAEDSGQTVVSAIEDILGMVSGLRERLSQGIDVLDIGCGRGRALIRMASLYPQSRFYGYELSEEAVGDARREALNKGLTNVEFTPCDCTYMKDESRFDLVTAFDAIHDQAKPGMVLSSIAAALRPGGVFLMQDIHASSQLHNNLDHPFATLLYTVSTMHCMSVSLAQGGEGLGTMWGKEKALSLLEQAGFVSVDTRTFEHDPMNIYFICRRD